MIPLSRRALIGSGLAATAVSPGPSLARETAGDFILGVQTHFNQRWHLPWMDLARRLGASRLRDGLSWSAIETRPGVYNFDPYRTDFLDKARRDGVKFLLVFDPKHPAYDDGGTPFSATGQQAFANYLAALLDRYGDLVTAIEIGNEINGKAGMTGPAASDRARSHVALLTAIHRRIKPTHPDVAVLGGSTNVIGVGFLERIFEAGGLDVMDGVAVHPYRNNAEHVDTELEAVRAAMRRHGREVPIYAPEFGDEVDSPEEASPLMLKMVAMMGAAGVRDAYWYVLSDEVWFRNMGLYTQRQALKPAGETFAWIQKQLLVGGRPERLPTDDLSYVYRFGRAGVVVWGVRRPIRIVGSGRACDARGRSIPIPTHLDEAPVAIMGDVEIELGPCDTLADSFHQFGRAPWSYFGARSDDVLRPLDWVYWDWTSYIGDRRLQPLAFHPLSLAPAGSAGRPVPAILRYTSPVARRIVYRAVASHRTATGDGVELVIHQGDEVLETTTLMRSEHVFERTLALEAGATVDLRVGPNQTSGGDAIQYRVTVDRNPD